MAINQNHLFEELNGVKCAIVEKNASAERADFLKRLLEYNQFTVVVVPTPVPPAKPAPAAPAAAAATPAAEPVTPATPVTEQPAPPPPPPPPSTFTVGVTDVMFNPINAIFGRLLKAPGGRVVTLAYWQQKDEQSRDDVPYFDDRGA